MEANFNLPPGCTERDIDGPAQPLTCSVCHDAAPDDSYDVVICTKCAKRLCVLCGERLMDEEPPADTDAICAMCEEKGLQP